MQSFHANLGGIASLVRRVHDDPEPSPREVIVRVRAAALNARDLMILNGFYALPVKPDLIPLADGSGEVAAIGSGVTRVRLGDRVGCTVFPKWIDGRFALEYSAQTGGSLDGMLTEMARVDEDALVHLPEHLSFEEAATLPCAAVTAWNALTGGPRVPVAGETVLTLGSGGVSLFALQFAKLLGLRVIATTSNEAKAARLKALGADDVIDYVSTPEWHERARELTGGRGVEHIVEVGGAGTLGKPLRAAAIEGQIALVGWLANNATTSVDVKAIIGGVTTMRRIAVGSRAQFIAMNRAIAASRLRPIIDRVYPFEDAAAALRSYETEGSFGNVVVRMG